MNVALSLAFGVLLAAASGPALAQSTPGGPANNDKVIPEKRQTTPLAAPNSVNSGRSSTLSDKLNTSNGVIKPSGDVDPGMAKPPPVAHPNSTPVIPPPGSPGGASGAVPK